MHENLDVTCQCALEAQKAKCTLAFFHQKQHSQQSE